MWPMCDCDHNDVWDDTYCNVATGRSLMVVFILSWPACQSPCNSFIPLLWVSSCNSCYGWWTTMKRRHGPWCHAGDDGDHARALEMMIKGTRRKMPYHITLLLHVMLILLCILFCLDRDGSIIRWSLSLNIKKPKCSPLVCTVAKFRRFETPRDDRVW